MWTKCDSVADLGSPIYPLIFGITSIFVFPFQNNAQVMFSLPTNGHLHDLSMPDIPNIGDNDSEWLVAFNTSTLFSHYHHFGCRMGTNIPFKGTLPGTKTTIPFKDTPTGMNMGISPEYKHCKAKAPVIVAPVIIHTEFHHTDGLSKHTQGSTSTRCDQTSPAVVLDYDTFGVFHQEGAVVQYPAFWMLSACVGPTGQRDCSTWNFVAQKLLWVTGNTVMIYNRGINKVHIELHINDEDLSLLLGSLKEWKCSKKSFMRCGIELLDYVFVTGFLSKPFVEQQIAWFKILHNLSYSFPKLASLDRSTCKSGEHVLFNPLNYSDTLQWRIGWRNPQSPISNLNHSKHLLRSTCGKISLYDPIDISYPWTQINDVLLIVIFNKAHYEVIPHINALYSSLFPHILYCGPEQLDTDKFSWAGQYFLSFVTYKNMPGDTVKYVPGSFSYECMIKALQINYHVAGYLAIADDLTLFPHQIAALPKNTFWLNPGIRTTQLVPEVKRCVTGYCNQTEDWTWWERYLQETINVLTYLESHQTHSYTMRECYQQLVHKNGARMRANSIFSDLYYIPSQWREPALEVFQVFLKHMVFMEIAIPSMINCLSKENIVLIPGLKLWGKNRDKLRIISAKGYELAGSMFIHPTKWSGLISGDENAIDLYCNTILPLMYDPHFKGLYSKSGFK